MANNKMIAVYGNDADRLKAALLAKKSGAGSISRWLLNHIRSEYRKVYGETNPAHIMEQAGE